MPTAGIGAKGRKNELHGEDREFVVESIEDMKSQIQIKHVRKGPEGGHCFPTLCHLDKLAGCMNSFLLSLPSIYVYIPLWECSYGFGSKS